jgi:hypothetical protein
MAAMMNKELAEAMAAEVVAFVKGAIAPLKAQLEAQAQEIAALKAASHLKFCGVWEEGVTYTPGNAVTRSGSLWVCKAPPIDAPGVDFLNWQLAVKRGHAG